NRADRRRWLIIENRLPRPTVIDRFKNAAVHRRHVENIRLRWNSCDRARPPAAVRPNVTPAQNRIELAGAHLPNPKTNRETDYDCISKVSQKVGHFLLRRRLAQSCSAPAREEFRSWRGPQQLHRLTAASDLLTPLYQLRSGGCMLFAIIFDLDGVLADSEPWWSQIDAKLLAKYGVTYRGEYHQNVVGVSYRIAGEFYKKAFGLSVPTEEMMRRRGEIATEFFANRVGLFPKVEEVLQELRQMKLHLAVATSSLSASARPFLDRHQLTGFFQVIVTGEEVERGKPAPDIDLRAADKLGIPADACLVVEDAL